MTFTDVTCPVCGERPRPGDDLEGSAGKLFHTDCLEALNAGRADPRGGEP